MKKYEAIINSYKNAVNLVDLVDVSEITEDLTEKTEPNAGFVGLTLSTWKSCIWRDERNPFLDSTKNATFDKLRIFVKQFYFTISHYMNNLKSSQWQDVDFKVFITKDNEFPFFMGNIESKELLEVLPVVNLKARWVIRDFNKIGFAISTEKEENFMESLSFCNGITFLKKFMGKENIV